MHEPMHLSRRTVAALPLAPLLGSAAAVMPAHAASDATLLDLGRRWIASIGGMVAFNDACDAMSVADVARKGHALDAEGKRLSDIESAYFDAIFATPAETVAGLAVKARILVREVEIDQDIDLQSGDDLRALERAADCGNMLQRATLGLLADIFRLAGELPT